MPRKITDLSYLLHEGMTTYPSPNHPRLEISQLGRHGIEDRETRKVVIGTHTGTHCDAPRHFIPGGKTIDQIPVEIFAGPATLVDLTTVPPGGEVSLQLLREKLENKAPERLVLRYDWSKMWGNLSYYQNHPYLTAAAAEWLVESGVKVLGMDTPTPDNPRDTKESGNDSPIHKILLGADVILLEYLTNLASLTSTRFELIFLPLKLKEGDGAPCRCIAIEE